MSNVSNNFQVFMEESGDVGKAFMDLTTRAAEASALDQKTEELAYIAVLAALRMTSGLTFHVKMAKAAGATREEIKSAVLVGLPAAGLVVTEAFALALKSYDE
ncbi:hypothetical protein MsAg5_00250 [Methanosarcinaceae archaeon Ag5]|uniref:Carboxymuconolactone decarboxylase-like domain-containing protein n=1 Tax=Methanolapillus africanus TaxID=3028297 RepID=A0AAE4SCY0_9EURY|nr:hypothetical protein [Methanosarcinaceae archaeon Ag5]